MFPFHFLLCLSSFVGVMSEETLIQSSPEIKKPGQSVKMSCKGSGFQISSTFIHWVQQLPGRGLTWIGRIDPDNGNTKYDSSYQGRFIMTSDKSINTTYLQIENLKVEDTATYYCAREAYSGWYYFDKWSPGSFVTVTSADKSAPIVYPMMPCCDILSSASEVTFGCMSFGHLPEPVDVTWNSGSITTGIKNFPGVLGKNRKFTSVNLLTVDAYNWKNNKYTCNVNHKATGIKINKDMPECSKPEPNPPSVSVLQGSCGETGSVDLLCLASGYSPDGIKIQWLLNGQPTSISSTNSTPYKDTEGNYESTSQISVPKSDWINGDSYTCRVSHPPSSSRKEDTIRKCPDSSTSASHPKVVLKPPTPKDLLVIKEATCTCIAENLSSPDSVDIKWHRSDKKRIQAFRNDPQQAFDGTYFVKSTLRLSVNDWKSGISINCIVTHSDLPTPIEKTIQYRNEATTEPRISCYPPPQHSVSEFMDVTCMLKGQSQKDIFVMWKKNDVIMDEENYFVSEPILDEVTDTYIVYTTAIINKADWNRGATLTCSGVLKEITSETIKKNRGK